MTDLTGTTLNNNYFLRELLGGGATANVYLAWDKTRSTQLAVKVLHEELAGDPGFQKMFKKEAEFMRELRHQNIVRLFDFGEDSRDRSRNKIVFIAMEYVKGPNLHGLLTDRKKPLGLKETSQVLAAVCKALHFAHLSKVLHCDVKPANILIDQSERQEITEKETFLADFGISHWALQQKGGGTPAYMAPELFRGALVTEQTDIYALGVTLYEMLSGGQLPFRGETSSPGKTPRERIAWEKANRPLPSLMQFNPDLPKPVLSVVDKALDKDPRSRHKSVLDIWNEFESACSGNAVQEHLPNSDRQTIVQKPPPTPRPAPPEAVLSRRTPADPNSYQPHLLGVAGEKAGQIILVAQHEFMIGRHTSNKLRFEDRTVSRYHATILVSRQGYYIRDDNSSIGTYVNGRRILPNTPERIRNGDRIKIGQSQIFEFRLDARARERQ